MPRAVTIRTSLIRSFAPLVLVVGVSAFAMLFFAGRFTVRTLSSELIGQTFERFSGRLDAFFEPVLIELTELAADARAAELSPLEPRGAGERFRRVVRSVPHVTAVIIADDAGREVMVLGERTGWLTRVTTPGTGSEIIRWRRGEQALERTPGPPSYDPRTRPWFSEAIAHEIPESGDPIRPHWTEPYQFFTSGEFGITVSAAVRSPGGEVFVIAIDVLLDSLDDFTRSLRLQKNGLAYLMDREGRVIGLPASADFADESQRRSLMLQPLTSIGHRLSQDAESAYLRLVEGRGIERWDRPYRFESGGRDWWAQVREVEIPGGLVLLPAIVVSEADLLGPITGAVWISGILGIAAILVAVWRCLAVAHRFSGPIEALAAESDRIVRGAPTIDAKPVRSAVLELAKLSSSQSEMRAAMRTLGKLERDLQVAREIQQATLPRSVPTVEGWDLAAWNEPADETGGDSYDFAPLAETGEVFLILADATGHGVGPALSVTQVRAMARMGVRSGASLADIMTHLNEQLCEDLPAGRFITVWAGKISSTADTIHAFSAGQGPLLLYRADRDEFETRPATIIPLGIEPDLGELTVETDRLSPGDWYLVFSDGIYEARSPAGELFGEARVTEVVRAAAGGSAESVVAAVRAAVDAFCQGEPPTDDRTGIVIKRR